MHKKSIVILTLISVLIIGTVFGIIHKKQSDSYEYKYVNNAEEKLTCAEVPDDFEYTDLMKKLAIYYFSEGLNDKEKFTNQLLEALVCKLEISGTDYDLSEERVASYNAEINEECIELQYLKELIESKSIKYEDLIEALHITKYFMFLKENHMEMIIDYEKLSSDTQTFSVERVLEEYNRILDSKKEDLHNALNKKHKFDNRVEEMFSELFGKDYENKTFDTWFRNALAEKQSPNQTTNREAEETVSETTSHIDVTNSYSSSGEKPTANSSTTQKYTYSYSSPSDFSFIKRGDMYYVDDRKLAEGQNSYDGLYLPKYFSRNGSSVDKIAVNFTYGGKDWLIISSKGIYGYKMAGGEIAVMCAPEGTGYSEGNEYCVPSRNDMPIMQIEGFNAENQSLFLSESKTCWWSNGYIQSDMKNANEITVKCKITFSDADMAKEFAAQLEKNGMHRLKSESGVKPNLYHLIDNEVCYCF